jgi:hypothetical protein
MASRQEEKEQRRREREEAEQAAQRSEARRKRIGIVVGGVLVLALLVAGGVLAFGGGGGDGGGGSGGSGKAPTFGEQDLDAAAKAAGCELQSPKLEGRGHTSKDVTYKTNPPTSGDHDPEWLEDGVYPEVPDIEKSVHALEHGRIDFQYKAGAPKERISQLEAMVNEKVKGTEGYHSLMFQNQTDMPAAVAATAWTKSITCAEWNDKVFDAFRAFRLEYVDKGPEFIP